MQYILFSLLFFFFFFNWLQILQTEILIFPTCPESLHVMLTQSCLPILGLLRSIDAFAGPPSLCEAHLWLLHSHPTLQLDQRVPQSGIFFSTPNSPTQVCELQWGFFWFVCVFILLIYFLFCLWGWRWGTLAIFFTLSTVLGTL